jgi:hypothetical protein
MQERKAMTEQWLERKDWMTGKIPEPVLTVVDPEDQRPGAPVVYVIVSLAIVLIGVLVWVIYNGHGV